MEPQQLRTLRRAAAIVVALTAILPLSAAPSPVAAASDDTTPPDTTIDSGPPAAWTSLTATFTFSGSDDSGLPVAFRCSLNGTAFVPCTSPATVGPVTVGPVNSFEVQALDAAGNVDPTPASWNWVVLAFNVASASSTGNTSITVTFDAPPDAVQAVTLANYSVPGLTLSGTPVLTADTVTITTSSQAAQSYILTVDNVTRASDATPLTTNTATFSGTSFVAAPMAGVSPAILDFGNVAVGSPSTSQQVTVTNTAVAGAGDLDIAQLGTVGPNAINFGIGSDQCSNTSLAPGASCTLLVTFVPTARGPYSATLQVPDDAADSPQSVSLSGSGVGPVAQVTPSSIDFGTVAVGTTSATQTVTITNTGDTGQDLVLTADSITGPSAADFAFVSEHCVTSGLLAAGASCTIELSFTPSAPGSRSATLSITDNAADSPQTVSLTGTGGTPSADLAVSIAARVTKAKGVSAVTYTITVLNAGPSMATDILINDALSSETTFVSVVAVDGSCVTPAAGASGVVSCSSASLASGSSTEIQIVVTVITKKASITNTVTVSATTSDVNLANNTASITTQAK